MTRTIEDILATRDDLTVKGSILRCEWFSTWMDVLRTDSELLPLISDAVRAQDRVTERLIHSPGRMLVEFVGAMD